MTKKQRTAGTALSYVRTNVEEFKPQVAKLLLGALGERAPVERVELNKVRVRYARLQRELEVKTQVANNVIQGLSEQIAASTGMKPGECKRYVEIERAAKELLKRLVFDSRSCPVLHKAALELQSAIKEKV